MDYDALASLLPTPAATWNEHQVARWLHFVHLDALAAPFAAHRLNGPRLLALTQEQLSAVGVTNSIIQRKLMRWIREGFSEYAAHLALRNDDKENVPPICKENSMMAKEHSFFGKELPLQRKKTTEREGKAMRRQTGMGMSMQMQEDGMVVRSCDGNLAAFYVMREKSLKIGRSIANTIRSLEVSVENEHAEIIRVGGKYYLRDLGTEAGTFIKIEGPRVLGEGTLVEMGSFLLEVRGVDVQARLLAITVTHMTSKGTCDLTVALQDGCSSFSFGRRKNNDFAFDDQHLSGMHARIFLLHGQFVLQDLHSTNGTWLRLSRPFEPSGSFPLEDGCTFKVGTTITYTCECNRGQQKTRMEEQYDDSCLVCSKQKRNVLMLPCRHNLLCSSCADPLQFCPTCRSQVQEKIKIYV